MPRCCSANSPNFELSRDSDVQLSVFSCEYHQVLETDLLLKCAQELDPSVVADVTTCMLQYQELDPNVVAGL